MHKRIGSILLCTILCVVLLRLPLALAQEPGPTTIDRPELLVDKTPARQDKEIVVFRRGSVKVYDPYPFAGQSVSWELTPANPTSFGDVATGDFNGDGDDEIVLLEDRNSTTSYLKFYDPVAGPLPEYRKTVSVTKLTSAGTRWKRVVAGQLTGDSRAEVVIVSNSSGSDKRSEYQIIDPGATPDGAAEVICSGTTYNGEIFGVSIVKTPSSPKYPAVVAIATRPWPLDEPGTGRLYFIGVDNGTCAKVMDPIVDYPGLINDLAAGDVDQDGEDELIQAATPGTEADSSYHSIGVWDHVLSGWPLKDTFVEKTSKGWWSGDFPGWGANVDYVDDEWKKPVDYPWGWVTAGQLDGTGHDQAVAIRYVPPQVDPESYAMIMLDPKHGSNPRYYFQGNGDDYTYRFNGVAAGYFNSDSTTTNKSKRDYIAVIEEYNGHRGAAVRLYELSYDSGGWRSTAAAVKSPWVPFSGDEIKGMALGDFDGPRLRVDLKSVSFFTNLSASAGKTSQEVLLDYGNPLTCTFSTSVDPAAPWLTISPSSGTAPTPLTLSVNAPGIPGTGVFNTIVTFDGQNAGAVVRGSPVTLTVTLRVTDTIRTENLPLIMRSSHAQ